MIKAKKLPYSNSALEPHVSRTTFEYHYGKHYQGYVDKLNELIPGGPYDDKSLEEIVKQSNGKVFNMAAQVWNHEFFFNCLTPDETKMSNALSKAIDESFGSMEKFKKEFEDQTTALFGSGWVWLTGMKHANGSVELSIRKYLNADTPAKYETFNPLLVLDVWEHAYYIDHFNDRTEYLKAFWKVVNWDFVSSNFRRAK